MYSSFADQEIMNNSYLFILFINLNMFGFWDKLECRRPESASQAVRCTGTGGKDYLPMHWRCLMGGRFPTMVFYLWTSFDQLFSSNNFRQEKKTRKKTMCHCPNGSRAVHGSDWATESGVGQVEGSSDVEKCCDMFTWLWVHVPLLLYLNWSHWDELWHGQQHAEI